MAEAMAVAHPSQEMRYAGQSESSPLCDTLASLYPHAEILLKSSSRTVLCSS